MKILSRLFIFISFGLYLNAQPTTFDNRYGTTSDSEAFAAICQGENGEYVALGGNYFQADVWVQSVDSKGHEKWSTSWGGGDLEFFEDIAPCQDGGFVFTGWTWSFRDSGELHKVYLTKLNSSGQFQWQKIYGNGNKGYAVTQTRDGGFAVLGNLIVESTFGLDHFWLLRMDANGDTLWSKTYQYGYSHFGMAMVEAPGGGFLLGGSFSFTGEYRDTTYHYLIRTNPYGDTLWTRKVSNPIDRVSNLKATQDILITREGHYLVGGRHAVFLMDDSGNLLWINYENGAKGVAQLNDGHFVGLTGNKISKFHRDTGDTLWVKYNDEIEGHDVVAADDGGFLMAGAKWYPDSYRDGRIIKVDCEGNVVDPVVCHPVGVEPRLSEQIDISFNNPVINTVFVSTESDLPTFLSHFEIIDGMGRQVLTKKAKIKSGTSKVSIILSYLSAGIYYFKVYDEDKNLLFSSKILKH